jgi:predicted Zn-dependent protease
MNHKRPQLLGAFLALGLASMLPAQSGEAPKTEGPYTDLVKAGQLLTGKRLKEAEALLRTVVGRIPKSSSAWFLLASTLDLEGKKEEALMSAKRAVKLDPKNAESQVLLVELMQPLPKLRKQCFEKAQSASKLCKGNPLLLGRLAKVLLLIHQPNEAKPIIEEVLAIQPKNADFLSLLAQVSLSLHKFNSAEKAYAKLVKLRPLDPWPAESRGNLLVMLGRKKEAVESFKQSLKIRPSNVHARHRLLALLKELGASAAEIHAQKLYLKYYKEVLRVRKELEKKQKVAGPGK